MKKLILLSLIFFVTSQINAGPYFSVGVDPDYPDTFRPYNGEYKDYY